MAIEDTESMNQDVEQWTMEINRIVQYQRVFALVW